MPPGDRMNKKSINIKEEQAKRKSLLCRWLIAVAAVLLLLDVFAPGINWILSAALRKNPVRNGHIEAVVPRSWTVGKLLHDTIAIVPGNCITRFCSLSTAMFAWTPPIPHVPAGVDPQAIAKRMAIKGLEEDGFANAALRSFSGTAGSWECFEGVKPWPDYTASVRCHALSGNIEAFFEGDPAHVKIVL